MTLSNDARVHSIWMWIEVASLTLLPILGRIFRIST